MKTKITINKSEIDKVDTTLLKNISNNPEDWHTAGVSEYPLYAYLSTYFNNTTILDIGTRSGGSALALSHNPTNNVLSYDLIEQGASAITKSNIQWNIGDFMLDSGIDYNKVSIIVIDVDPHDGQQERIMMDFLRAKKWKGLLIHDDIGSLWPDIVQMWNEIPEEKYDITHVGHFSGTGLINFGNKHVITVV